MAVIGNKFIFTTEGRTSLVAQLGGIRFSVLGAVLIQGIKPLEKENDEIGIDFQERFEEAFANLTLESLSLDNGVVLGLKNVDYNALGGQKIFPVDLDSYQSAVNNITQNLIPLHYVPAQEVEDTLENVYGIYELDVDKTLLACNFAGDDTDVSFAHIGLIGKQYTQTDDATYNVDHTQKPVLVGIAQLDGEYNEETNIYEGGIQILAEQNQYVNIKLKLRFTLDERDRDIELDINPNNRRIQEVLAISDKLSLVNNGLKTNAKEGVKVASDKSIIANFNLNKEGALATDKTLMVAETYNADELENEWNGVGLIHLINRENQEYDDENPYTPQVVLSTIEHYENLETEPVVSYNVMMLLQGKGKQISVDYENYYDSFIYNAAEKLNSYELTGIDDYGFKATGVEVPKFVMSMKPEYDNIAVDIFGLENKIIDENNVDKFLFSKNNFSYSPIDYMDYDTIVLGAGDNYLQGNAGNTLINAGKNVLRNDSVYNTLVNSLDNIIQCNGQANILLNSHDNIINIYGFIDEYKSNVEFNNCTLINSDSNIIENLEDSVLINAQNNVINTSKPDSDSIYNINIIGGEYNEVKDGINDLYLMCSYTLINDPYDMQTENRNDRTLILGNNAQWDPRKWNSRPGILYGNGNINGGDPINALEFFPDEGLLKIYNKDRTNTITIGGNEGIKFPDSVNQSLKMTMKTLNVTDEILLDNGNNHILLDVTGDDPYISLINNTSTAEFGSWYFGIERANGDETIINADNIVLHSNNGAKKTNIDSSEWSIENTSTKKSVKINPGHVIIKEDVTSINLTVDTTYQKVTADIMITPTSDSDYRCYEVSFKNAHGNEQAVQWLKTLWEEYTPIAYGGNDNDPADLNYAGIRCNNMTTLLDLNDNNSNLTHYFGQRIMDFDTYQSQLSNINATLAKFRADSNKFYYTTPLPSCFSCIDEVELNIYVGDTGGKDISLVWLLGAILNPVYPYKAPTFKLNLILNYLAGISNNEGEDLYVYTHKVYTDVTRVMPEHIEQKSLDFYYDDYITLLGKPANFMKPTAETITRPGYMAWRVISEG